MLNEKRVKLMTRMASYEAKEGKKYLNIGHYFRDDYISKEVLKSVLSATVAFGICFALYFFYGFEGAVQEVYKIDIVAFVKHVFFWYVAFVVGYGAITYRIYSSRYRKAKKSLKRYYNNLRKLSNLYD